MVTQASSMGSLVGHSSRLAAEGQSFLMSALLGLLCFGLTANYYTVLHLTSGNRPACHPDQHEDGVTTSWALFRSEQILLEAPQKGTRSTPRGCGVSGSGGEAVRGEDSEYWLRLDQR